MTAAPSHHEPPPPTSLPRFREAAAFRAAMAQRGRLEAALREQEREQRELDALLRFPRWRRVVAGFVARALGLTIRAPRKRR